MSTTANNLPLEDVVVVAGVGLIGGSLAGALKRQGVARTVWGLGRDPQRLAQAQAAGLIDQYAVTWDEIPPDASLAVVCTPVDRVAQDVREAAKHLPASALITDAGSVKGPICAELDDLSSGPVSFVGSHPLAGSEKQGFEHALPTLFAGKMCVITPSAQSPRSSVERLHRFWQAVGMRTCEMSPAEHDTALAKTSHLPHAVAAALSLALGPDDRRLAATGFRDTTRIAAGDPDLWAAIFQQNSAALTSALALFEERLSAIRHALSSAESAALKKLLQQAKTNRDALD